MVVLLHKVKQIKRRVNPMIEIAYILVTTVVWPIIKYTLKGIIIIGSLLKFGFVKTGIWVWVAGSINKK